MPSQKRPLISFSISASSRRPRCVAGTRPLSYLRALLIDQCAPYQLQPIILGFEAVVSPPYLGASLSVLHMNGTFILHFELTQKATPLVYLIFTIHRWGVLNWQLRPVVLGFEAAALDIAPWLLYLGASLSVLCASSILHQWDLHLALSKINSFSPNKCPTHLCKLRMAGSFRPLK